MRGKFAAEDVAKLTSLCRITSIKEDIPSLTTYLAAEPAPWSDVAGSYDLDFVHLTAPPKRLGRRNWFDGNFDITKENDGDLKIGSPHKKQTIWHDDT